MNVPKLKQTTQSYWKIETVQINMPVNLGITASGAILHTIDIFSPFGNDVVRVHYNASCLSNIPFRLKPKRDCGWERIHKSIKAAKAAAKSTLKQHGIIHKLNWKVTN